jgi:hypothetical protein
MSDEGSEPAGAPVGRRTVLGLLALGGAGIVGGSWVPRLQHTALGVPDSTARRARGTSSPNTIAVITTATPIRIGTADF